MSWSRQEWWIRFRICLATEPIWSWTSGAFVGGFIGPSSVPMWSIHNLGAAVLISAWWTLNFLIFRKLARRSLKKQGVSYDTNTR